MAVAQPWRLQQEKEEQKITIIEGSLEVKLPTTWTDEMHAEVVRVKEEKRREEKRREEKRREEKRRKKKEERRKKKEERRSKRESQKKEDPGKSRNTVFSQ